MSSTDNRRFSPAALYDALDEARGLRGMSWREVAAAIGVSPSTLTRAAKGGRMESDGAIAMARWVGLPLEAFSETNRHLATDRSSGERRFGRVDTRAIHAVVDEKRASQAMTWRELADELDLGVAQLTHLSKGGRVGVHTLLTILEWLQRDAESVTREL